MIYFLQTEQTHHIKIGYCADDPDARLANLQTGCPTRHRLLLVIPGDRGMEGHLHDRFDHLAVSGEWFLPGPDLIRFIIARAKESGMIIRATWQEACEADGAEEEAMEGQPAKTTKAVATEWLVERFAERREWPSRELFDLARLAGIGRDAIFRAKDALGVPKARKVSMPDGEVRWVWWVPDDWEHLPDDEPVAE